MRTPAEREALEPVSGLVGVEGRDLAPLGRPAPELCLGHGAYRFAAEHLVGSGP